MADVVADNERIHDRIHGSYEQEHEEIFNDREQTRLRDSVARALSYATALSPPQKALDYGCGSGNLTRHLLDSGLHVTSADVSGRFLDLISERFGHTGRLTTLKISGRDVDNIEKGVYDFVGTYSVLHHIPDYLQATAELSELVKPGGVLYLDHEVNEHYWNQSSAYQEFSRLVRLEEPGRWRRFFTPSKYVNKLKELPLAYRRLKDPRYMPEGDLHVWPDDHIKWDKIEAALIARGYRIVMKQDYLLFRKSYPVDLYERYQGRCSDMRLLVAKRIT